MPKKDACTRFLTGIFFLCFFLMCNNYAHAQENQDYDEITVFLNVPRVGGTELSALIKNEAVFLSIPEIFGFLKIYNTYSPGFDTISGFLINQQSKYMIDRVNHKIEYRKDRFELGNEDIIRTETNIYLRSNYFGDIFGLECSFNFRTLTVTLNSKIELPVIREMRLEQMRKNMSQITGEVKADTTFNRSFPLFSFGVADWMITSNQQIKGATDTRLSLNLGSVIAGGETNITLNYNVGNKFKSRDQYYLWRYANNDKIIIKQISLGKIQTQSIATLSSPVIGAQITNAPTTYRKSYGTYTLSEFTEPDWMVELYVNNVLVDYKKADASGFFSFNIPLIYGNTNVKLQFYGPWGEERSKERTIIIPFNFLPKGELEYKISAGIVEDTLASRYSRANIDYGITKFMTLGGGVEYLSSVKSGKLLPFVRTSLKLAPSLLLSGEFTYGSNFNSVLSYRLPFNIQLDAQYTKYAKNQKAIITNYSEERKLGLSVPLKIKNSTLFTRVGFNQFIMSSSKYTSAELLLSGTLFGVSSNLTTTAIFSSFSKPDIHSNLALSVRLPYGIIFSPQVLFNYSRGEFVTARSGVEKKIKQNGYINLSYDHNFSSKTGSVEIGFRYDFSFAKFGFSARKSGDAISFVENASGSIQTNPKNRYFGVGNRSAVGKSGIVAYGYLDKNANGKRDINEQKIRGIQVKINGGRIEYREKDTSVMIFELEPYAQYLVSLAGSSFDNISWQLPYKNISVVSDPNQFKIIEIPVVAVGEVAGTVYLKTSGGQREQGRIRININKTDKTVYKNTISEEDGYYSYLGLKPGKYLLSVDPEQLRKLNMKASPEFIEVTVHPSIEGEYIEGLDFVIEKRPGADTVAVVANQDEIVKDEMQKQVQLQQQTDSVKQAAGKVSPADVAVSDTTALTLDSARYSVQILASRKHISSLSHFVPLAKAIPGTVFYEKPKYKGVYRYRVGVFDSRTEAENILKKAKFLGWKDAFIVFGPIVRFKPIQFPE